MMMANTRPFIAFIVTIWAFSGRAQSAPYYGKLLGKLSELHHGVSGEVYAVDSRTLFIKDFTYDGQGPAAYFYASTSRNADRAGFRLRDENGSPEVIRRYRKEGVTLTLPDGKLLNSIKIFYVWCEEFAVNFGDVKIPRNFDYPRPQKIQPLKGVHAISSDNIVLVDAQTLLIPNLSYDGDAPDAKFWVGRGPKPSPQGIRVPDENGKEIPLRRYDRKTVVLTLPGDLTIFDIGHFGIWCEAFTVDFGHIQIPQNLNVPPSLKQLGVSPQSKLNCEVLYDDLAFEVRWAVAGDSIVLQLVAKLDDREYVSFGVSGDDSRSEMIGGDVVVAWIDKETSRGSAEDYYLGAKSQCSGPTGSCPDNRLRDSTNNVRLLNAAMVNGYSIITYQRPLKPSDEYDRQIHTNHSQAIIWAIGPLNQRNEVSFHSHYTKGDQFLDFGRTPKWNCPMPEGVQLSMSTNKKAPEATEIPPVTAAPTKTRNSERRRGNNRSKQNQQVEDSERSATRTRQSERVSGSRRGAASTARTVPTPAPVVKREAWDIPAIQCYEPEDGVFYAQMGPTGGKRGYSAITGHVGWGISWYINGLLIPEINVVRGRSYTFVVEGGFDPEVAAKYHPFYITDDSIGGYEYKTEEEKKNVRIFAGASFPKDGDVKPTGTGRLCHWTQQGDLEADDFESFGAYQRTLELKCDQGEPGVIQWTPDKSTPDTVYYQCFTHRYLGWKINVHDSCDGQASASEPQISIVPSPDLQESPSLRIESRVKLNELVIEDTEDKNNTTVSEKSNVTSVTLEPAFIQPQQTFHNVPMLTLHDPFYNYFHYTQHSVKPKLNLELVGKKSQSKLDVAPESPIEATTATSTTESTITSLSSALPTTSDGNTNLQNFFVPHIKMPYKKNNFIIHRPSKRRTYSPIMVIIKKPIYSRDRIKMSKLRVRPLYQKMRLPDTVSGKRKTPYASAISPPVAEISTGKSPNFHSLELAAPVTEKYLHTLKPAINTGFHPESVVIENDFKPIVSQEIQKRILKDENEPEYKTEIGVISPQIPQTFEPVFIPSPIDKPRKILSFTKSNTMKYSRSLMDEEPVAEAAEKIESYYLPPLGKPPQISNLPQQRSNIDIEASSTIDLASPPDVVVTYDGKRVSGASLTAKIADRSSILDQRTSKATELIKARPQFVPFKGELPPLNPDVINRNVQLREHGVLSRHLDTPLPPVSTKLSLVQKL